MEKELIDYIEEYIKYSEIQGRTFITGEYKTGNKAFRRMEEIVDKVKGLGKENKFFLSIYEKSSDANTLTCCCVNMLKFQIEPQKARRKLEDIKNSKDIHPIFVFNARIFLQELDKGNIKLFK